MTTLSSQSFEDMTGDEPACAIRCRSRRWGERRRGGREDGARELELTLSSRPSPSSAANVAHGPLSPLGARSIINTSHQSSVRSCQKLSAIITMFAVGLSARDGFPPPVRLGQLVTAPCTRSRPSVAALLSCTESQGD